MRKAEDVWKICALCRHMEIIESGRALPDKAESEYNIFRCKKLNVIKREDHLANPFPRTLEIPQSEVCPFWEAWNANEKAPIRQLSEFSDAEIEEIAKQLLFEDEE